MALTKYRLQDIAEVVGGGTPSTLVEENYGGEIVWITPKDLSNQNSKFIEQGERSISDKGFNSCSAQMIPAYNILMSSRAPIGLLAINKVECCTNQGFKSLILNKSICDVDYIYYYLKHHFQEIEGLGTGTTFKEVSKGSLLHLGISIPPLEEQQIKARLLSCIDAKIALNRSINHNLEAMAKQLYDYWFVQFDFPDENGKPYKSSGGKMVWNEKLKREIPEGWHCFRLNEIEPNIVTGKTPSTTDETNFGGAIPFITIDDIRKSRFVFQTTRTLSEKGAYSQLRKYIPIGSLCCSCIGTVGILGFVGKRGQTNQQLNTVVFENEYNKEYIYFSLGLYFRYASAKVGNILPNMSKDDFSKILLLYPTKNLVMEYHKKVKNLFNQIECIIANIESLTKQRDSLLPLLMNGQVSLNYDLVVSILLKSA